MGPHLLNRIRKQSQHRIRIESTSVHMGPHKRRMSCIALHILVPQDRREACNMQEQLADESCKSHTKWILTWDLSDECFSDVARAKNFKDCKLMMATIELGKRRLHGVVDQIATLIDMFCSLDDVTVDRSAGKMGPEVAPQGQAHDFKQQRVAQTIRQRSSQSRFECFFDEDNILEEELPRPLSSGRGNSLPGCWARDELKIDIDMTPTPV